MGVAKIVGSTNGNSSRPISLTASVVMYSAGSSSTSSQFQTYNGFLSGASTLYIPRFVRKYYCYNSGLTIQNFSSVSTMVQFAFTFNGTPYSWSQSIGANGILGLYAPDITSLNGVDGNLVGDRIGSGTITVSSGGPIAAIVNEDNRGPNGVCAGGACGTCETSNEGYGSTLSAIPNGSQKTSVVFPQLQRKVNNIFSGGWTIQNTSTVNATCTADYKAENLSPISQNNISLPANSQLTWYLPNVPNLSDGFNGAVTVSCNQAIFGIGNSAARNLATYVGDSFVTYNGIGK
ncbi:MAG: hypothetical protein HC853_05450 [Anaerolineae bacterium]|nr:hypothetical protein [Anaerolineae bacterium]